MVAGLDETKMPWSATLPDRFWKKVNKHGPLPENRPELGPCWIWTAALNDCGYGRIGRGGQCAGVAYAHRVAYVLLIGPIPDGLELDHLCRRRACVNPRHLEVVTPLVNTQRAVNVRGEAHPQTTLTASDVLELRRLHANGAFNGKQLAAMFGVSPATIHRIVTRETWGHLDDATHRNRLLQADPTLPIQAVEEVQAA